MCFAGGYGMNGVDEKFTITVEEEGLAILDKDGGRMRFTAGEALMLLDILRCEEAKLKKMAQDASPISFNIKA